MSFNNADNGDFSSGEDNDDVFDEDMEALRQACMLTGANPDDLNNPIQRPSDSFPAAGEASGEDGSEESEDDLEVLRSIQNRFSISAAFSEPLSLKPLATLPPASGDEEEDDFATLSAIRRRFAAYDDIGHSKRKVDLVHISDVASGTEKSNNLSVDGITECNVPPPSSGAGDTTNALNCGMELQPLRCLTQLQSSGAELELRHSSFPRSAQFFVAAIRKNRSCQKLLRNKLTEIEARMEENKKLRERVQILKTFQVSCKKLTGKALSQRKDPLIQLISAQKAPSSEDSEINDKRVSTIRDGPLENSHVANYRKALKNFPLTVHRKKWTKTDSKNLGKGIRQQFQEMVLHLSVDQFSGSEGSFGDNSNLDSLLASIRDLEITPELMREFLPKVNWDQLASLYVTGHSGAECAARWLNFEDPLIDSSPWEARDDKNLLLVVQEKGISNWFDIAASLDKKRTPFGCLLRFQRSLNARILKREWTKDEDVQLNAAVEVYGYNWQAVASCLEGRTGAQCSNRWRKSLNPYRQRKGTWTLDEDKCLKVAVKFFGPKNWNKIAQFVPGRTQVQCRERWFNALDPSLNMGEWTEEEDLRLKAAVEECGYGWAEIAKHCPGRTDSCCRRRWRFLAPHEVPKMQAAYRMKKAAFIGNFVDRESERPALSTDDFLPLPTIEPGSELENLNPEKHKQKSRVYSKSGEEAEALYRSPKKSRSKRTRKGVFGSSEEASAINNGSEFEKLDGINLPEQVATDNCVEDNTRKRKKGSILSSKRNKSLRTSANCKSLILLPLERLELEVTNNDGSRRFAQNGTPETARQSPDRFTGRKQWSRSCETVHNSASVTICDNSKVVHDNADSSSLAVTSDVRDILGHPNAFSKKKTSKIRKIKEIFLERINAEVIENYADGIASQRESEDDKKHSRGERRPVPSEQKSCPYYVK